jgi:hypothetical protein
MAGTAKNYNSNQIILGPCDVWLNVALPAGGARMVLHTDGTPTAADNPGCVHLGMTEAGVTFEYTPEIQDFGSDELTAPHFSRIVSESARITGNFLQVFNWQLLNRMTVGGTLTTTAGDTTGYEQITFGGLSNVSTFPVALIGQDIQGSNQYWVVQLYKTFNKAGFSFTVTRRDQSKAPFEFMGMAVTSRTVGDQIGNFWHIGVANTA